MTLVIVTHEMGFAREIASEVIFMDDGRVLEKAAPGKLFNEPENARTREFLNKVL